jgi:biotin transport system substrate-specific component
MLKNVNKKNQELKFSLITIVLTIFCTVLLVIATFTQLKIFTFLNGHFQKFNYVPQIPIVLFTAGFLGKKYGALSIILYILAGLFFIPIFALGGGLDYILNPYFGYIIAFIFGIITSTNILSVKTSLLRLLLSSFLGILTIHIIGIIYLAIVLTIEGSESINIFNSIANQSLNTFFIDLLFGFTALTIGNYLKIILKKFA